jgi:metal-sulfur cluster biosynthetic enzyme
VHPGEAVQPHLLDQASHRGARVAQPKHPTPSPQSTGQRGEIEHQRGVAEHELTEVDDDVAASVDGSCEGAPPVPLGGLILVSSTTQYCGAVIELDDSSNLHNSVAAGKAGHVARRNPYANGLGQKDELGFFSTLLLMATVEAVTDALRDVIDPELGLDFVELGLIYDVEVDGGTVRVTYTLTSPGCPIGPQVSEQIEEFVSELDGVDDVQPTMTFSPPWTPDRMSEDAKFALGF